MRGSRAVRAIEQGTPPVHVVERELANVSIDRLVDRRPDERFELAPGVGPATT
jgi:hypothetical protein